MNYFKIIVYLGIGTNMFFSQHTIEKESPYFPMDKRLLERRAQTDRVSDSVLLQRISTIPFYEVVYTEKDLSYASKEHYYFPIENLAAYHPALVSYRSAFIPDIYSNSEKIVYNRNRNLLELTMRKKHHLAVGDYIMLENKDGVKLESKIEEIPNDFTFSIKNDIPKSASYFVRGKKVKDLQHIDQNELLLLNMRINQLLNNKIITMEEVIIRLEKDLKSVKSTLNKLKK